MWQPLDFFDDLMLPATPRHAFDFYETRQLDGIRAGLKSILPPDFLPRTILDPTSGNGTWAFVLREMFPNALIVAGDINPAMVKPEWVDIWYTGDYLYYDVLQHCAGGYDLIGTNPPYAIQEQGKKKTTPIVEIQIRKAYKELAQGGYLTFQLIQKFIGSQGRVAGLFREIPIVCSKDYDKRFSYFDSVDKKTGKIKKGSTDNENYVQILFQQGHVAKLDHCGVPLRESGFIQWGS